MAAGMDQFDYPLPAEAIAQEPAEPRESARLLVAGAGGEVTHRHVRDLPDLLHTGDVLVVNETRVLPARLHLRKPTGGQVEVLLLEPLQTNGHSDAAGEAWSALVRPGKRVAPGTRLLAGDTELIEVGERADGGTRQVRLLAGLDALAPHATVALPPYIHKPLSDPERYQTVYASRTGSVAAPTAGLHLSHEVLDRCRRRGVEIHTVDLSVGLDTFRPITADRPEDHVMHAESYSVPASTMDACRRAKRVVAVGTTTVRALEAAAASGELTGRTKLFIHGDYRFQAVDVLLTNFHVPRSSLLLLLAAFHGAGWRTLYELALAHNYRFLSFGDAMLIPRAGTTTLPSSPSRGPHPRPAP
ncbi:MAG TPA: tRNA preQ1(34) S-adenosylmethionine ribosyltransferase-isomerase QueA [Acidimicrobiales bacterium]|nr:tRNA preQ1(34) S-adenosylmethionine ribosyltransferase-isomerase QueA [Acidimicrobiales bacterium]